jgi:hypothetical protein
LKPFKVAVNLILVGPSGHGKNYQIEKVWSAVDGDRQPFARALLLTSETSAMVASSAMITDPRVHHVVINTPEDLYGVNELVAEGHKGQPFDLVIFDGWSHLQDVGKADERATANEKDSRDNRVMAARASPRLRQAAAAWSSAVRDNKGTCFISTCHVAEAWRQRPGSKDISDRIREGYKLDISFELAKFVQREGNAIVYLHRVLAEIGEWLTDEGEGYEANLAALQQARRDGHYRTKYYAFTEPVIVNGDAYGFVKWQDGLFAEEYRPAKFNPDLGTMMVTSPLRNKK